jgi:hypothetical protein
LPRADSSIDTKISIISPYAAELCHSITAQCPGLASISLLNGKVENPDSFNLKAGIPDINFPVIEYIDTFAPRNIKAQMFFNPSIKLGDTIRFSGGLVDVRRTIIGVVTSISWKYHGIMTINCSAPTATKEVA